MKALFATSGWLTHYYMIAPLAWAFRSCGHDVRVAGPAMVEPFVVGSGLPFVAAGPDVDFMAIRRRALEHESGFDGPETEEDLSDLIEREGTHEILSAWQDATFAGTEAVVSFARSWHPDIVVADTMSVGGLVAAGSLGVPAVRHLLATDILGSVEGEGMLKILPGFADHFRDYGAEFEVDPADRTIDPCPPSMQPPPLPSRMQMRYVPYNGTGVLPSWLLEPARRPRVCVTWGTSALWSAGRAGFQVPEVLHALEGTGAEVVLALGPGQREHLGTVPDNVRVVESLPLHLVMPGCDLLVSQGGSATMLTASYYGVPQLTVPYLPEQVNEGEAHAATGAGLCLPAARADRRTLGEYLERLLTDRSFTDGAERLRAEIHAQPDPISTVRSLEELAGG